MSFDPEELNKEGYAYQRLRWEAAGDHDGWANHIDTSHQKLQAIRDDPNPDNNGLAARFVVPRGAGWLLLWTEGDGCAILTVYAYTGTESLSNIHRWPEGDDVLVDGDLITAPQVIAQKIWNSYVMINAVRGSVRQGPVEASEEQGVWILQQLAKRQQEGKDDSAYTAPTDEEIFDLVMAAVQTSNADMHW